MSELIDISGKKISYVQTTYADLFSIYSSLGNMTPALAYFTRKVREKFMKLNGERIKSINQKYVELQMKYFKYETVDNKNRFVVVDNKKQFNDGMTEEMFMNEWQEYLSHPVTIME